jgi:hypothetical protein
MRKRGRQRRKKGINERNSSNFVPIFVLFKKTTIPQN